MIKPILEILSQFKLEIVNTYFNGPRYIKDKQAIADSLDHKKFTDECGAIYDCASGQVWVVYLSNNCWKFSAV